MNELPWPLEHKLLLVTFWNKVAFGRKQSRSKLSKQHTLSLLKFFASYGRGGDRSEIARHRFNRVKAHRHSLVSRRYCFCCGKKADARHHIIPLKKGGLNCKRNIISLCSTCHASIHPWMKKGSRRRYPVPHC
jgi:5-methylcytosine-specific restriction endonuclease McrA